jgi:3-methyladenine DNA glycosylase AlkD
MGEISMNENDLYKKMIRKKIFELADDEYKKFQENLCPDNDNIVGVRLPLLRDLAREIAKGDWRTYIKTAQDEYYEEIMLQGMVIGCVRTDVEERLRYITNFVPKIDNWGVCDSFCSGLKFTKSNMQRVWDYLQSYASSGQEFEVRFFVVMLLDFYIKENYVDKVLKSLDKVKHKGYYVRMAVAWAVSTCYIKFPEKTMEYLKNNTLDNFTYNKALQKIMESLRVGEDAKVIIRSMKRK